MSTKDESDVDHEEGTDVESEAFVSITPIVKHLKVRLIGTADLLMANGKSMDLKPISAAADKLKKSDIEPLAYRDEDGYLAVPYPALRRATIDAGKGHRISKTAAAGHLQSALIQPEREYWRLTRNGKPIKMFEIDSRKGVNRSNNAGIMIHRPCVKLPWECEVDVRYREDLLPGEVIFRFLQMGGDRNGILAFRVQKGGWHGTYAVEMR